MSNAPAGSRKLIGRMSGFASRQRIYRTPEALEVDETDHYQIYRRRVFFDDVVLVTLHRATPWLLLFALGVVALAASGLCAALFSSIGWRYTLGLFAVLALPLWVAFVLRLALGDHVLTVHGRRTRAQVRFPMRAGRARETFTSLCADVRRRQEGLEQAQRAAEAAAAPRSPLPPPPDEV